MRGYGAYGVVYFQFFKQQHPEYTYSTADPADKQ